MTHSHDATTGSAALDEPTAEELATLQQRSIAFNYSHDPRDLWPGADLGGIQAAATAIGGVVRRVLDGSRAELVANGFTARELGVAGLVTGVGPLLGLWCERAQLSSDDRISEVLATHLRHGRARSARIRAAMGRVIRGLAERGVMPGVVKGFHTGLAYFPEPGARPFFDVDLIVRSKEVAVARDVLRTLGYREGDGYRRPYKRTWSAPDHDGRIRSFDYWHAHNGWNIELCDGISFDYLRGQGTRLRALATLNGEWLSPDGELRVPTEPQLFALLAVHASGELYSSRLLRLVELVLVIRKDEERGTLDWHGVEDFLGKARALRFAYPALRLADQLVPGVIDASLLRASERASTERTIAVVEHFTPTSPVLQHQTSLSQRMMWASGWRGVARQAWLFVTPFRGMSARTMLRTYHSRLLRVVSGSVRLRDSDADRSDLPP